MKTPRPTPPSPACLDDALIERLCLTIPSESPAPASAQWMRTSLMQRIEGEATDFLFVHHDEGDWVTLLRGVELKLLHQAGEQRSYLLRLAPGARIPRHQHPLDEESLILSGDLSIDGVVCHPGDYHFAPRGKPHGRLVSEHGCLLFVRGASDNRAAP